MIRTTMSNRRIVFGRFYTAFSRPNETLLLPWRLAAMAAELASMVCLVDARVAVVQAFYPGDPSASSDNISAYQTYDAACWITILCLAFSALTFVSARLLRYEAFNVVQCCRHTLSAILNFMVWYRVWHPVRVWHIWIWFTMIPIVVEVILVLRSIRQGTFIF